MAVGAVGGGDFEDQHLRDRNPWRASQHLVGRRSLRARVFVDLAQQEFAREAVTGSLAPKVRRQGRQLRG